MLYQQNEKSLIERHFVPLERVKIEIIGVTGQSTEFFVEKCARAQEIHQNAANQSNFQSFKPFHLELSGTINGTVARSQYLPRGSNQFARQVGGHYQDQFENNRRNRYFSRRNPLRRRNLLRLGYSNLSTTQTSIILNRTHFAVGC